MWFQIFKNAEVLAGAGGGALAGVGGNQRIPEAMSRVLKAPVRFKQVVAGIRADPGGAGAVTRDGGVYRAKAVITTLPISAQRLVPIDPAPPATLDAWLENLGAVLPGNKMAFAGIKSPTTRAALIDYLKRETR